MIVRGLNEVLADLPESCALHSMTDGKPILVKRGEIGYWAAPNIDVDGYNSRKGITPAQKDAMQTGSVFGFNIPGADPLNYPTKGK